jgi:hypothetical protein
LNGKVYSIGAYDSENRPEHIVINYLVTHPQLEKQGGGTAVLRSVVKQSILTQKKGINLLPTRNAESFYRKRGFVTFNPDQPEEFDIFDFLERDQIRKGFPEMAPFLPQLQAK